MLFRECAFWAFFAKRFCSFLASLAAVLSLRVPFDLVFLAVASSAVACCTACSRSSSERCAYHTSNVFILENSVIASRYEFTQERVISFATGFVKSLLYAAIVRLAASRFTSYSKGPGSVSSKSLMSKTRRLSGEANTPKFDRWASPHSWTSRPAVGVPARSAAMIPAAPR